MRALHLDFRRAYRPVPWAGLLLLVAALGIAGALGHHHRLLERQIAQREGEVDRIRRMSGQLTQASPTLTGAAAKAQRAEAQQVNQVLRQLGLPWNALFLAVEEAAGPDIGLLALEPDLQRGVVRIGGEAKNFDALLAYVKRLSSREVFGSVMLQQHQVQVDHPDKPVRFALVAKWKDPSL